MARTKGAVAKSVDNRAVRHFLLGHHTLSELPGIVEDCICGALGQEKESRRYKGDRVLAILRQLDYIDTLSVHQQLWDYNVSQGNHTEPSKRNTERMARVLRTASGAIYYHMKLGQKDEPAQTLNYDLSEDEIELVRHWALAGDIEKVKEFLSIRPVVTAIHSAPVFSYTEENVVVLSSRGDVSLRPSVNRPYCGDVKKAIKDKQPEDIFTIKGSEKNLQPLIEEIGRVYMKVENVA